MDDDTPLAPQASDPFGDLQVAPGAEPEVVEAAYRALQRKYSFSPPGSPAAERLARVEAAWSTLQGSAPREAAGQSAEPASPAPAAPVAVPAPISQGRLFIVAGLLGLIVLLLGALAAGVFFVFFDDDDGGGGSGSRQAYPIDMDDADYDLDGMALTEGDMPDGIIEQQTETFTNVDWAELFASVYADVDPERKNAQFDAQGRVRNRISFFSRPPEEFVATLGKIRAIESHSTLYENETAASEALSQSACGLLINDNEPTIAFTVPLIADEATGFFYEEDLEDLGKSVDTIVCFRTGRVVHAVVRTGLDGTQSTEATVELARLMLSHVDEVFFGPPAEAGDGS